MRKTVRVTASGRTKKKTKKTVDESGMVAAPTEYLSSEKPSQHVRLVGTEQREKRRDAQEAKGEVEDGEEADLGHGAAEARAHDAQAHARDRQQVQADAVPRRVERRHDEEVGACDAWMARVVEVAEVEPREQMLDDEKGDDGRDVPLEGQEVAAVDVAQRAPGDGGAEVGEEQDLVELRADARARQRAARLERSDSGKVGEGETHCDLGVLGCREVPAEHVLEVDDAGEARVPGRALEEERHRRDAVVARAANVVAEGPSRRLALARSRGNGVEPDRRGRDARLVGRARRGEEEAELLGRAEPGRLRLDRADVDALQDEESVSTLCSPTPTRRE